MKLKLFIMKNWSYIKDIQGFKKGYFKNITPKLGRINHSLTLVFFLFFNFMLAFSQNLPSIQLDRPDQTECPFITPKGYIQIENGVSVENVTTDHVNYTYPSSLWKYGVNEKLELRLVTELVSEKIMDKITTGIMPITLGFKVALLEERGILPKISFIGHFTAAQIGSEPFRANYAAPAFRFTMQHSISKRITLAYNLGTEWNGEAAEPTYIYTLTTGIGLTDKIGFYAEAYGFIPSHSEADHRCDAGFTYLITDNLITDLSGGLGLSPISPKNYLAFGLSYRFRVVK
jgi:hypothetical protein